MAEILDAWPNCQTADCENKSCVKRNSVYCSPCTDRLQADHSAPARYFDDYRNAVISAELKEERK
jgi:hypothetical protein